MSDTHEPTKKVYLNSDFGNYYNWNEYITKDVGLAFTSSRAVMILFMDSNKRRGMFGEDDDENIIEPSLVNAINYDYVINAYRRIFPLPTVQKYGDALIGHFTKSWVNKLDLFEANNGKLFNEVFSTLSSTSAAEVTTHEHYQTVSMVSNVIGLVAIIQATHLTVANHDKAMEKLVEIRTSQFPNFASFQKEYISLVESIKMSPGLHTEQHFSKKLLKAVDILKTHGIMQQYATGGYLSGATPFPDYREMLSTFQNYVKGTLEILDVSLYKSKEESDDTEAHVVTARSAATSRQSESSLSTKPTTSSPTTSPKMWCAIHESTTHNTSECSMNMLTNGQQRNNEQPKQQYGSEQHHDKQHRPKAAKRWCDFHQSSSHDNSQCKAQQQKPSGDKQSNGRAAEELGRALLSLTEQFSDTHMCQPCDFFDVSDLQPTASLATHETALVATTIAVPSISKYLDSCASNGVANTAAILHEVTKINSPAAGVIGITGTRSYATHRGNIKGNLGPALLVPTARYNLVSLIQTFRANPGSRIEGDEQGLRVYNPGTNSTVCRAVIDPSNDLFKVVDMDTIALNSQSEPAVISSGDLPLRVAEMQYGPTVQPERSLTAAEKARALLAILVHRALDHPSDASLSAALNSGTYSNCACTGRDLQNARLLYGPCLSCLTGKATIPRARILSSNLAPPTKPGEGLHIDIAYFFSKPPTIGGHYASLISVCHVTGKVHVVHISNKDAVKHLMPAIASITGWYKRYNHTSREFYSDSESVCQALQKPLNQLGMGITHQPPGGHEKVSERNVRTVRERMRAVAAQLSYEIPPSLEGELVSSIVAHEGMLPNVHTGTRSVDELCTGIRPSLGTLPLPWGSAVSIVNPLAPKNSPDHTDMGIIVGPSINTVNSYRLWCPVRSIGKQIVTRSGTFTPLRAPLAEWRLTPRYKPKSVLTQGAIPILLDMEPPRPANFPTVTDIAEALNMPTSEGASALQPTVQQTLPAASPQSTQEGATALLPPHITQEGALSSLPASQPLLAVPAVQEGVSTPPFTTVLAPLPTYATVPATPAASVPVTSSQLTATTSPVQRTVPFAIPPVPPLLAPVTSTTAPSTATVTTTTDQQLQRTTSPTPTAQKPDPAPTRVQPPRAAKSEALRKRIWGAANLVVLGATYYALMSTEPRISLRKYLKGNNAERGEKAAVDEIINLQTNDVGEAVDYNKLSHAEKKAVIHGFMFLKDVLNPDGSWKKTKARYVANGTGQHPFSYGDISSSTLRPETLNMLFAIAALEDLESCALDVPGAFMKAKVEDGVIIHLRLDKEATTIWLQSRPADSKFVHNDTLVIRLTRYLYGLHQSPQKWFLELRDFLLSLGYTQTIHDPCLYVKIQGQYKLYVPVFVDDKWVVGTRGPNPLRDELKAALTKKFGGFTEDDGTNFIGLHIRHDRTEKAIYLDMKAYLQSLFDKYSEIADVRTYTTPATSDFFKPSSPTARPVDSSRFLSLLMSLYFPARFVRRELLPFLAFLARKGKNPDTDDATKLIRLYGYVKYTIDLCVRIKPTDYRIGASVDASFGIHYDGKSHTGIILTLGGAPIGVISSKQDTMTLASTGAETIALATAVPLIVWARLLMQELGYKQNDASDVGQDNQSNIILASGLNKSFARSKHLFLKYHFIKEHIDNNVIRLKYVPSARLVADILTKLVAGSLFFKLRNKLYGYDVIE